MSLKIIFDKTGVINDPHGQSYSPAKSDHCFHLRIGLLCAILEKGDGRTVRTDDMFKNSYHYRL